MPSNTTYQAESAAHLAHARKTHAVAAPLADRSQGANPALYGE